jgi:hypothetical protein
MLRQEAASSPEPIPRGAAVSQAQKFNARLNCRIRGDVAVSMAENGATFPSVADNPAE